jgi:hypothetical protein
MNGMLIWLLALLLLASLAGLGYRQGAIRVAFSLVGILFGLMLAGSLGNLIKRPLMFMGLKNPLLVWLLAPFAIFLLFSIIFKIAALPAHKKMDVYFKYHAGDLRQVLWERLSRRLGLCLGLVNGAIYFILISFVIYAFSYWTVQMASSDADPGSVKLLNRMGRDLETTGFAKVDRAIDFMPQSYYDAGDIAGLIYQNSLLEARLERYPGFLGLALRPEFQALGSDKDFAEMRQRQDPIRDVLNNPQIQGIVHNPELLDLIWTTVKPDLKDIPTYLETGKSPHYDQVKILGRWDFNVNAAFLLIRRAKPNIPSKEMQAYKRWMVVNFDKTTFIAAPDHQAVLRNVPSLGMPTPGTPPAGPQTMQGQWQEQGDNYALSFPSAPGGEVPASFQGDHLVIKGQGLDFVFDRED